MSNYEKLLVAIEEHVETEVGGGRIVDVKRAAMRLSSQYPQSGIAIDEIARIIESVAVKAHGAVYNGSRPISGTK